MDRDILAQLIAMRGNDPMGQQLGQANDILSGPQPALPPQALPPGMRYPGYQVPPGAVGPDPGNPRFDQNMTLRPLIPQMRNPMAPAEIRPTVWDRELSV